MIGIEHAHHARNARLGGPAPRIAGQRNAARGRAVVGAVARHDLVPSGKEARDLDGVLVGLGAAVGEEESVDVAGGDFGELRAQARARLGRHEGIGIGERRGLLVDRAE